MTFPRNSLFCCLALKGPTLRVRQEHTLMPGLTISDTQTAFELEPHWVKWLGSIQAGTFQQSSLYITAVSQLSENLGLMPGHQSLFNRVRMLHQTLILLGCGYSDHVLLIGGNTSGGSLHIGPVRSGLRPSVRPFYRKRKSIGTSDLESASAMIVNLENMYADPSASRYRRLRKGFNVWIRGSEEIEDLSERFHAFIRSSEAIIKPTIMLRTLRVPGRSKRKRITRPITSTFLERGQTLIGHSAQSERLLGQFYDIRSCIEHIKEVMPAVKKASGIPSKEAFVFRALQAEILAGIVYRRILSSCELMNCFSSERMVEGFWSRTEDRRQALWGGPIDLEIEARSQFQSHVLPNSSF